MTPEKLLKLQAKGTLVAGIPQKAVEKALKYLESHSRPQFKAHRNGGAVKLWASNTDYNYLLGQNKKGTKTIDAIDTSNNGCYEPITVKTDSGGNVWTACEENGSFNGGQETEYSASGSYVNSYAFNASGACPPSAVYCVGYQFDGGSDGLGNVYAMQSVTEYEVPCTFDPYYYCFYDGAPGIWKFSSPSSSSYTAITLPGITTETAYYMATDSSGNVYFDYDGCDNSYPYACGVGLAEFQPGSSGFTALLPPGTFQFAGGVEVNGSTLSVTDQDTRYTYQYHLPVSPSSTPFRTLGQTATPITGEGDPVSGGFNSNGSRLVQGDAYGFLDTTKTSSNGQKNAITVDDLPSLEGAAFAQ